MNAWIAGLLALPGFFAWSQAMERHHEQVSGVAATPAAAWCWRGAGAVLLLLALVVCLQGWGTSVAVAAWLGVLMLAALAVALLLTYAANNLRWVAAASLLLALWGVWVR